MAHVFGNWMVAKAMAIFAAAIGLTLSIGALALCVGLLLIGQIPAAVASDIPSVNENAEGFYCPQTGLTIYTSDDELAIKACKVSETASIRLASCGLSKRPSINLHIVHEIKGAAPHCLGVYVCDTDEIAVLHPSTLANSELEHAGYQFLEPDRLFESLIVHELAHAKLVHALQDRELSTAAHEYIAYAMQLSWLSENERTKMLARAPTEVSDTTAINEFVLSFDPELFFGLVWRHFEASGNGCDYIKSLISGSEQLGFPEID